MEISIIIPFVNEKEEVYLTIESIIKYSGNITYEIILINDASDDSFDYVNQFKEKQFIRYYKNTHRIGVAACRDMGVSLSSYNKFLLLDAHMRIYDTDTLSSFIETLSDYKRAIVCCRTIGIGSNPREMTPYGAFLELWGSHGGLYAQWNEYDTNSEFQAIEIPCILGAAYAAYKDYWLYLRGLNGLMSYGSDEAYISLKVWLSGGKCILLKNIIVGHLYRKDPPYKIKHVDYVYNKVFISLLLLPVDHCLKILNCLCETFRIQFNFSLNKLYENISSFIELKEYYNKILTTPYDVFSALNNKCRIESELLENIQHTEKKEIINSEIDRYPKSLGLYSGKMGLTILLYLEGNTIQAEKEMVSIVEGIETENLDMSFDNGLLGIAWGINFLIKKGLIEGDESLLDFDDCFFNFFNFQYYSNWTFEKGIIGLIYYSTIRLYHDKNILFKYPIFFKHLYRIIRDRLTSESSNLIETDFPLICFIYIIFYDKGYKMIDQIDSLEVLFQISNIEKKYNESLLTKGKYYM